jgi:hypothetical protein
LQAVRGKMKTWSPGTNENGFASLDAMVAILLVFLAWTSIGPVTASLVLKTRKRQEVQERLYEEKNYREERSWIFPARDKG